MQIRALWVAVVSVIVFSVIAVGVATFGLIRLRADEHQACVIQARGLPAGHHLATAVGDIAKLLQASRLQTMHPARGVSAQALRLLIDLEVHADAYATLESRQPGSQSC